VTVSVHPDRQATPAQRRDPCAVAHGEEGPDADPDRELLAVYASEVAAVLLRWGRELGFRTVLLEPDPERIGPVHLAAADEVTHDPATPVGAHVDVVVTDHHREDLGRIMAPLVRSRPRWIGIMGSPRHTGPHREALREEGVGEDLIDTVHRPIGLDIGSKEPAEIALSTLAGLLADRNGRPGT
jgi:xanthine dehydrogenase accessory factor